MNYCRILTEEKEKTAKVLSREIKERHWIQYSVKQISNVLSREEGVIITNTMGRDPVHKYKVM